MKYDPARYRPLRRIVTVDAGEQRVRAKLTDNVHQFSVVVEHRDGQVTAVQPMAHRVPWTSCPAALARLHDLVGAAVGDGPAAGIDKTLQCTHLFDITRLAMAQANRPGRRRYDVDVALGDAIDTVEVRVVLDGAEILHWTVADSRVISEGPFHGQATVGAIRWPDGETDPDVRDAALMARRALLVFLGSGRSFDAQDATQLPYMTGVCHTFQAATMAEARRPEGFRFLPASAVPEVAKD